jgi:hypothetical protein
MRHRVRSGKEEPPSPYTPSRCTKHPKRTAGVWVASGTPTACGVIPAGGVHVCDECWYDYFPPLGKKRTQEEV